MESRLVRSVGSRGPAGGVMGSVIVPAVWIGWGVKGWGEKPWKKGRGGDTSITCAPSDPSLPLSLHGQTHCLRGGAHFHRQMHIPLLCSRQHSLLFLSCRNLIATIASLMHFSFICHCQKNSIFSLKKKGIQAFFYCVFMFDHGTWSGGIRLKMYNKIKSKFTWTEQFSQTYSAGYMQLS